MPNQEDIKHQQSLLEINRMNTRLYQRQVSMHQAGFAPPSIIYGLRNSLSEIDRIKRVLRGWGITTPDQEGDTYDMSQFE